MAKSRVFSIFFLIFKKMHETINFSHYGKRWPTVILSIFLKDITFWELTTFTYSYPHVYSGDKKNCSYLIPSLPLLLALLTGRFVARGFWASVTNITAKNWSFMLTRELSSALFFLTSIKKKVGVQNFMGQPLTVTFVTLLASLSWRVS